MMGCTGLIINIAFEFKYFHLYHLSFNSKTWFLKYAYTLKQNP